MFTLTALFIFYFITSYGQAGQLDPSFGKNGIVRTDIGKKFTYTRYVRQILPLPDNSMYVIEEFKGLTKRLSDGSLDSSFGFDGDAQKYVEVAAIQPDGKIVAIGSGGVNRYNTNGTLDHNFSNNGKLVINVQAEAIAIQKDGKIVLAGFIISNGYLSLARYNTDGTPDSTFSGNGVLTTHIQYNNDIGSTTAIAIQTDGKIVIAGVFPMVRYNSDGTADETFNGNGTHGFPGFKSIAIQNDGKIAAIGLELVAGDGGTDINAIICRLNTDGSLDTSFSGDGKQPTAYETASLAIQNGEKIVIVGSVAATDESGEYVQQFEVTVYNTDGSPDKGFSGDGVQTTSFGSITNEPQTVAVQPDGKIVVGGSTNFSENIAIARYNTNGSLDDTFDKDGKLVDISRFGATFYKKTVIQKDGKIVVAGSTYNGFTSEDAYKHVLAIVRYNKDGSLDNTFSSNGIVITNIPINITANVNGNFSAINLAVQSNGKIIAASEDSPGVVCYNNDGSLDSTFHYKSIGKTHIRSLAIQTDDKIVVEDFTSTSALYGTFEIRRYNSNGNPDRTFGENGVKRVTFNQGGYSSSIALQNNGKIVVGGVMQWGSSEVPSIALFRLNTDGSLDNTFSNDGKIKFSLPAATYSLLAIQKDDKIIIGGDFTDYNSFAFGILLKRFNSDGSIDSSFSIQIQKSTGTLGTNSKTSITTQNDGKILLAGINLFNLAGSDLLRFNINGSLDSTLNINSFETSFFKDDIVISDNKLYAAGGNVYGYVARYLLDENDTPPTVSITTPADNAVYTVGTYIKVNATATDADGTITKVELYSDNTLLYTQTVIPYGFQLKHLPVGKYTITVKSYDNSGNVTTSAPVHITVIEKAAPVVSITTPANYATYTMGNYIKVNAAATDADGTITKVDFYADSALLHTKTVAPYRYQLKHLAAGTYTITAKATDNLGLSATSAPVTITVSNSAIVSSRPYSQNEKTASNSALSVRVFPNPATQIVNLQIGGLKPNKPATISLISNAGIVLQNINISNAAQTTQLNVSSLVKGVYTIKIVGGSKTLYKKFVKL